MQSFRVAVAAVRLLIPLSEQTPVPRSASSGLRERGEGRPTKKERRALDKLLGPE